MSRNFSHDSFLSCSFNCVIFFVSPHPHCSFVTPWFFICPSVWLIGCCSTSLSQQRLFTLQTSCYKHGYCPDMWRVVWNLQPVIRSTLLLTAGFCLSFTIIISGFCICLGETDKCQWLALKLRNFTVKFTSLNELKLNKMNNRTKKETIQPLDRGHG